jgi:hypothetical protein
MPSKNLTELDIVETSVESSGLASFFPHCAQLKILRVGGLKLIHKDDLEVFWQKMVPNKQLWICKEGGLEFPCNSAKDLQQITEKKL